MSVLPVGISGEAGEYQIERSLRFNSSDSSYMSRTPASAGNRKTWTWSGWVKRSNISDSTIVSFGTTSGVLLRFSSDTLQGNILAVGSTTSTAVYRDPCAWYHIMMVLDTTQASNNNRFRLYVNGSEVVYSANATITQNADLGANNNTIHTVGVDSRTGSPSAGTYFNGYLAEVHFIDGSALDPTSFGEFDTDTGVWKPKAYSGSYGTNGFYLDFGDNSSTTALGYDAAGSNDWTPNNFSVTAGAGNDSLVDSPTRYGTDTGVGGEVRGNYCTLNPLNTTVGTLSNGNLQWVTTSSAGYLSTGTMAFDIADSTNKFYFEFKLVSGDVLFGIAPLTLRGSDTGRAGSYGYYKDGNKYSGTSASAYGASFTSGDVIGVAVGAGKITFYKNGTSQGDAFTGLSGYFVPMIAEVGGTFEANFGQRAFNTTAPSGFKALCTTNLP